ncbi:prepilin-type N-terminal cleavage/methylation domain-containing protein [Idiomarina sp. M1R2S28]|uniref:Prepilin-type N-terminal cleavage/methylation domain-containing protein n=1 Tax=Idiomarina rhizosphaerae TaxID=2961572 RepID=A0A9X2JU80_9GAMM|nr:prepilin-type N-terminal cleavage/methylation domain-containing protein [Idiomarina rhizosphaerae]MCP1338716.1 prepilin-type N-terminal cleavage/methylation domain-containing protein [Idiomarina rhizosphaerae]
MKVKGFTLVELIIVIVLLAVISTFTFRFVGIGAEMYATGASRLQLLEQSRFAVERITRELRNSVPNSARVTNGNQCLEFVPVKAAGTYYDAPFSSSSSASLDFVSLSTGWDEIVDDETSTASLVYPLYDRLFIYATQAIYIYQDESSFPRRWAKVEDDTTRESALTDLELEPDSYFAQKSPLRRMYVGKPPVRFCVEGTQLIRYSNYGWENPPDGDDGVVISEHLMNSSSGAISFRVINAELMRNNVVHIFLEYQSPNAEPLFFNQKIHIPNAP